MMAFAINVLSENLSDYSLKTLVSSKNLVLLSRNPIAFFLDITLKLIQIHLSNFAFLA